MSAMMAPANRSTLPAVWPAAVAASMSAPGQARAEEEVAATALAAELADELLTADAYLFAVPLYNFGVPQHVKHWIDLVIMDPQASNINE